MATSYIIGRVENGDYGLAIAYGPLLRELPHRDLRPGPAMWRCGRKPSRSCPSDGRTPSKAR
jgi:hypothetical protein